MMSNNYHQLASTSLSTTAAVPSATTKNVLSDVLLEARTLVTRLHERDRRIDSLLTNSNALNDKINCMKEYQEDTGDLSELPVSRDPSSKQLVANPLKPHYHHRHSIKQENRQIKQLQEENRKLRTTLEEYEGTLELVMQKHRKLMNRLQKYSNPTNAASCKLMMDSPLNSEAAIRQSLEQHAFSDVFSRCLQLGTESTLADTEEIARLQTENETLRELLRINRPPPPDDNKGKEENDGDLTPRSDLSPEPEDLSRCSSSLGAAAYSSPPTNIHINHHNIINSSSISADSITPSQSPSHQPHQQTTSSFSLAPTPATMINGNHDDSSFAT